MGRCRSASCDFARLLLALGPLLAACDAGAVVGDPASAGRGGLAGSLADGGPGFLPEPAERGLARELRLLDARWGRRVDVYGLDPARGEPVLVLEGLVVDPTEPGAGLDVTLEQGLLGSGPHLTIQHAPGSPEFARVLERLEAGAVRLRLDGPAPDVVPRDATLELRFSDLVDPRGVGAGALSLLVDGVPVPLEVTPARSHGARVDGELRSARLQVALVASLATAPDAQVRLVLALGASSALANLSGHPLVAPLAGPALVLPFRAGGSQGVLPDTLPPFVVGELPGQVTSVLPGPTPTTFGVDFQFTAATCALAPQRGDTLGTPGHLAEVLGSTAPAGGATIRMRVRLAFGDPTTFVPDAGTLRARWTSVASAPPECFVTILPTPAGPPAVGVGTAAVVRLAFSEPMEPTSVRALDTFRLTYGQPAQPGALAEHVVGAIQPSTDLSVYTFQPALPLRHAAGVAERYRVQLTGGAQGVRDLAGNPLAFELPQTTFLLDPAEPAQDSASLALRFTAPDEDGDGAPELRGQVLYDLSEGTVRARPLTRFSAVADASQPLIGAMVPFSAGLQTPLNPLGAKLMSVWRYVDLGMGLLDEVTHNLDVEGLAWAPLGGAVVTDQFAQFRMALAHAAFLPDEAVAVTLLPKYIGSGLVTTYDLNLADPLDVVHDKAKGYAIDPAELFVAPTGTAMMPWPMNRNVPLGQYSYWTWRDTAGLALGGPGGAGADPQRLEQILGPTAALVGFFPAGQVPTIALPLLTEYRCYPDPAALGLNAFRASIAINSSAKPTFRAYSAGGIGTSGTKLVDPDLEPVASGGINPSTGGATAPIDNVVYHGQADFVVRVSRAHTRWLDTGAPKQELLSLLESRLPAGTEVQLAFRGASSLSAPAGEPWLDAGNLGPYGDPYTGWQLQSLGLPSAGSFRVAFFPTPTSPEWTDDLAALVGARYLQVRITFVGDASTQAIPALDGLGLTWRR